MPFLDEEGLARLVGNLKGISYVYTSVASNSELTGDVTPFGSTYYLNKNREQVIGSALEVAKLYDHSTYYSTVKILEPGLIIATLNMAYTKIPSSGKISNIIRYHKDDSIMITEDYQMDVGEDWVTVGPQYSDSQANRIINAGCCVTACFYASDIGYLSFDFMNYNVSTGYVSEVSWATDMITSNISVVHIPLTALA